jgi:signal transduction histidine kinase
MMRRRRGRRPPPWWPEAEPWPPRRAPWRRGRARFIRRIAVTFAALLLLAAFGLSSLLSMLLGEHHPAGAAAPLASFVLLAAVIAGSLVVAMRRIGSPLGDIVGASQRIAAGDYTARVVEHGPPSLRTVGRAFNRMAAGLESQEHVRRQLMADIAHELRTPLSIMQGRIEGLIDGVYPVDDAQLGQVLTETRVLARLVDDLRTLAQAEAGTLTLQKEPTDMVMLVHDVVAMFSGEAKHKGVDLNCAMSPEVPPALVDPVRLREILINLVANALHYTERGGRISVDVSSSGDRIAVAVADTGAGIAPEDLPRIFDRFYKGASSRGSGLGLAIARNLVVAHGGTITAESQPGRGTTMTFSVPAGS